MKINDHDYVVDQVTEILGCATNANTNTCMTNMIEIRIQIRLQIHA